MLRRSLLLALALVPLMLAPAHSIQQQTLMETRFRELSDTLVCQCGCNLQLSVCGMQGCESATPMRKEIREKLDAGETNEEILASFVDRYGLTVLSAPPTSGFNLSAWIMPFVVLIAGAWVAKSVLGSWRRETVQNESVATEQSGGPDPVNAEQKARIERELRDFDA